MYGWRGKIGFVCPAISDTVLLEYYRVLPEGVLITTVDLKIQNLVETELVAAANRIEEAIQVLEYEQVQAFLVGGTPPITRMGFEADRRIIEQIHALTGKPASTEPTFEVEALRSLSVTRIAMVSPFAQALNQQLKSYYEYAGFEVVVVKELGIVKPGDIAKQRFNASYLLSKEAFLEAKGMVDAVFIACPRWPTVRSIGPLEMDLGVPVVTSAQAAAWKALTMLGIREVPAGFGQLFAGFDIASHSMM
jgi:maleate isomerase